MDFERLKEGKYCVAKDNVGQNLADTFVRKILGSQVCHDDFLSYYELGKPNDKDICSWVSVSVYQIINGNKEVIIKKLTSLFL